MEKTKWSERVSNEQVLELIRGRMTLLNNILRRKVNWIGHILRRNCLLHDTIEGQMTEVKGVGRRTELLDDLRNRRRYWELKEKKLEMTVLSHEYKEEVQLNRDSPTLYSPTRSVVRRRAVGVIGLVCCTWFTGSSYFTSYYICKCLFFCQNYRLTYYFESFLVKYYIKIHG